MNKEREAFEKWANENIAKGRMMNWQEWCWEAWQAAKAQAVPEGYKIVPVEPKQETIKQMNKVWFESNCAHIMKTKTAELLYKAMIEPQEPK